MCSKGKNINFPRVKPLLRDYSEPVYNSLIGVTTSNKNVVVLKNHNIILRRDYRTLKGRVKIIGGGGAGIEPAEAYYVGKGMLTAAVLGDMYSSPSANEVLVAIREVAFETSDAILLLVKNYVGDKLNFGLALDLATSEGIKVKMLVIGDDTDNVPGKQGRKGLAGSVLVYKIAGEMAEQEKTLEEIIDECRENILTDLNTIGITFPVFGKTFSEGLGPFLEPDEMVIGMGLYGQHGKKKIKACNIKDVVKIMLDELYSCSFLNFELNSISVVVMVNNYGSTSKFEESVIAAEVSKQLTEVGIQIAMFYSGNFMSGFNPYGFSVTILKVNSVNSLKYLEGLTLAPTCLQLMDESSDNTEGRNSPNIIYPFFDHETLDIARFKNLIPGPILTSKAVAALKQTTIFAAEALISCERQLNVIDSEVGDGDTGTVLAKGAGALKTALINDMMTISSPFIFLSQLSDICCKSMGGLSGALYSIFFSAAAKIFKNACEITPELCSSAFRASVKAIKHSGKAELGDRTMLDVLCPAVDSFESAIINGKSLTEAMYLAVATCEYKSEETKSLKPPWQHNMSIKKSLLYPDAGAHAVTIWLRAIGEGLKLTYPCDR